MPARAGVSCAIRTDVGRRIWLTGIDPRERFGLQRGWKAAPGLRRDEWDSAARPDCVEEDLQKVRRPV
jgi:hypothetical protein